MNDYLADFHGVYAYAERYGVLMTHIPVHPHSRERWGVNLHGHLHSGFVELGNTGDPDPGYFNVGLERNKLMPFSLDQIRKQLGD